MNDYPEVSVVMSVYNGGKYLTESINSILEQTHTDFEFIIVNDGSSDNTRDVIEKSASIDNRIVMINQKKNRGLAKSLNAGIRMAKGKFIARQDADDISFPERLEKQLAIFKRSPDTILCGTWFEEINENNGIRIKRYPISDKDIRKNIKYQNLFCHPSVIFSKRAFDKAGGYDENFTSGQDFELWIRMAEHGKVENLPIILVKKRIGFGTSISWERRNERIKFVWWIYKKHFRNKQRVKIGKFFKYFFPMIVYPMIPASFIRLIRRFRYRPPQYS